MFGVRSRRQDVLSVAGPPTMHTPPLYPRFLPMPLLSFLDRHRTIARPDYNRWLIPPAALAIHLAIGQVYAFSVFKLPLARTVGVTAPAADDWSLPAVAW